MNNDNQPATKQDLRNITDELLVVIRDLIDHVDEHARETITRFDAMDRRFDTLEQKVDEAGKRLDARLDSVETDTMIIKKLVTR